MKASEELSKVGGVAVEVLSNTRIALETIHAEYMAHLEVELQALRLVCNNKMKGFAEFANKFLKPDYKHILGIENLIWNRKGGLKIIDDFHHDFMNAFRKSGAFEFIDQTMYNHGFYKATVLYEGNIVKNKGTFFPDVTGYTSNFKLESHPTTPITPHQKHTFVKQFFKLKETQ